MPSPPKNSKFAIFCQSAASEEEAQVNQQLAQEKAHRTQDAEQFQRELDALREKLEREKAEAANYRKESGDIDEKMRSLSPRWMMSKDTNE